MNLDRFNQPMSWESRNHDHFWDEVESDNEKICCGCGEKIFLNVEAYREIDTDEFIHEDKECFEAANEKSHDLGIKA